jgi:tellurite resistance protein TerC
VPFINGGEPIKAVPEISISFSLAFIATTLAITTLVSLISSRRDRRRQEKSGAITGS